MLLKRSIAIPILIVGIMALGIGVAFAAAPVAQDDAATVDEGGTVAVLVLANDSDLEGDTLSITAVSVPTNGTAVVNDNGTPGNTADDFIDYSHDGSETTSDSFTYKANDGVEDSNEATVNITINPVNDAPPVAVDDSYSVEQGDTLTVDAASGVLANDTDADDDDLTAIKVGDPTNGTLTLNDDGSFEYTPDAGFDGDDSFTYHANDGEADSNVATVSIAVSPPGERRKAFVGVITEIDPATTTVTLTQKGSGESVTISLEGEVQFKFPGGPNKGSLEEGAEVVILTRRAGTENEAIFVLVKPVKPTFSPFVGTVTSVDEDGVITILLPNGKTKKVRKPKGTEDPEDGEVLTVIVENTGDGDGEGDGEVAEATGLVKASKVADRIQSFLLKLAAKDDKLPQAAIDARQRLVANLAAVLEQHSAQNVSIIERASKAQGLGSGTAAGIQRALEKAQAGQAKGKAIADDAKSKVGPVQNAGKGPKNIFGPSSSGDGSDDDDGDSGGSGKPDGSGKPADAGSQGSNRGNKGGNSGG